MTNKITIKIDNTILSGTFTITSTDLVKKEKTYTEKPGSAISKAKAKRIHLWFAGLAKKPRGYKNA